MTATAYYIKPKGKDLHIGSKLLKIAVWICGIIVGALFVTITAFILIKGIPNINLDLFAWKHTTSNMSMMPAIFNTIEMVLLTLLIAVPIGVLAAVYMVEYAKKGSKIVAIVRLTTETLQGIPSIIFGLFGMLVFVYTFEWGKTMLAGVMTLVLMILPVIIRTTEEALLAVPDSYREGSFSLGAGKVRTVFRIVMPAAIPGILSGVILATGRIFGETAALVFTSGTSIGRTFTGNPTGPGCTLAVYLYILWNEGLYTEQAYAVSVVLLVLTIGINALSAYLAKKVGKKNG